MVQSTGFSSVEGETILIAKPGKPTDETSSYRPISLLSLLSKLFERLLLQRLRLWLLVNNPIPEYHFGFRERHGTVEQVHRVVDVISKSLEEKRYCSAAFPDISQAFDRALQLYVQSIPEFHREVFLDPCCT